MPPQSPEKVPKNPDATPPPGDAPGRSQSPSTPRTIIATPQANYSQIINQLLNNIELKIAARTDAVNFYTTGERTNLKVVEFLSKHPELNYFANESGKLTIEQTIAKGMVNTAEQNVFRDYQNATKIAAAIRAALGVTVSDDQGLVGALTSAYLDKNAAELISTVYQQRYKSSLEHDLNKRAYPLGGLAGRAYQGNRAALLAASIWASLNLVVTDAESVINIYRGLNKAEKAAVENELGPIAKNHVTGSLDAFYKLLIPAHLQSRFNAIRQGEPDKERAIRFQGVLDQWHPFSNEHLTPLFDELAQLGSNSIAQTFSSNPELKKSLIAASSKLDTGLVKSLCEGDTGPYTYNRIQSLIAATDKNGEWELYQHVKNISAAQSKELQKYFKTINTTSKSFINATQLDDRTKKILIAELFGGNLISTESDLFIALRSNRSGDEIAGIIINGLNKQSASSIYTNYKNKYHENLLDLLKKVLPESYRNILDIFQAESNKDIAKKSSKIDLNLPGLPVGPKPSDGNDVVIVDIGVDKVTKRLQEQTSGVSGFLNKSFGYEYGPLLNRLKATDSFFSRGSGSSDITQATRINQLCLLDEELFSKEKNRLAQRVSNAAQTALAVGLMVESGGTSLALIPEAILVRSLAVTGINALLKYSVHSAFDADISLSETAAHTLVEAATDVITLGTFQASRAFRIAKLSRTARKELGDAGRRITQQSIDREVGKLLVNESPLITIAATASAGLVSGAVKGVAHAQEFFSQLKIDPSKDPATFIAIVLEDALLSTGISTVSELKRRWPTIKRELDKKFYQNQTSRPSRALNSAAPTELLDTPLSSGAEIPKEPKRVKKERGTRARDGKESPSAESGRTTPANSIEQPKSDTPEKVNLEKPVPPSPAESGRTAPVDSIEQPKSDLPEKVNLEKPFSPPPVVPSDQLPVEPIIPEPKRERPQRLTPKQKKLLERSSEPQVGAEVVPSTPSYVSSYKYDPRAIELVHRKDRELAGKLLRDEPLLPNELQHLGHPPPPAARLSQALKAVFGTKSLSELQKAYPSLEKLSQKDGGIPQYSIKPAGAGRPIRITFFLGDQGPEGINFSMHYGDH